LRGQGAPGVVKKAREYLMGLDLGEFKDISERQFNNLLKKHTEKLRERFPEGAKKNWGAARKAINCFLEDAFYNRFLAKRYNLDRLEDFLELPLDSNTIRRLKEYAGRGNLPRWRGIKNLKPEDNKRFQECAKELANRERTSRIHRDLEFWRGTKIKRGRIWRRKKI